MRKILYCLLPLVSFYYCTTPENKEIYNPEAIELNELAVTLFNEGNSDSALVLLDKAITLDETYYIPHLNKIAIYVKKQEHTKALYESEMIIKKKPDAAEQWALAGTLHEWHGNKGTALNYYNQALRIYDNRIVKSDKNKNDQDLFNTRLNRAMVLVLIGNEDVGREEMRILKTEFPQNELIDELLRTRREDFINQIFHEDVKF